MKIGILGGTFDPIHNGHLMIAEYAYKEFSLDMVWMMPNGNPPHKQDNKNRVDAEVRAEMVELAIRDTDYFMLQPYEVQRTSISYTYETMEYFTAMYPEDEFYFIIGADSLFAIESWYMPERIFKTCVILAAFRDEKNDSSVMEEQIQLLKSKYDCDIRLLVTPVYDAASSEIRELVKEHKSISGLVPADVESYIMEHGLYLE